MSMLAFQIPEKVLMEKSNEFYGIFTFKPLEKGYATTIGNALRRVLLSSLDGYAITFIKIPGIKHEFSSIKGVVEDLVEIVLNLKKVRFKKLSEVVQEKISISIKNQKFLQAKDIVTNSKFFKVLNPELVIFNIDENINFNLEIIISKGRGYVSADESIKFNKVLGFIPIDSIFTPIINVKYSIENIRLEKRSDYEKLIIEIQTDGSIHPENALKRAVNILIRHFILFSDKDIILDMPDNDEKEILDEEILHVRKLLQTSLSDLDLSVRAFNCLKAANIKKLSDLVKLEISDMMKFRNFGKKSLAELEALVSEKNLSFGMDLLKYKIES